MSNLPERQVENTLLNTDDAMLWAQEFCRIFEGTVVSAVETDEPSVDPGTMVGWFANAMQTAINQYERKKQRDAELIKVRATQGVPDQAPGAFIEGFEDGREERRDEEE
jgi:hypothetical protein